jgi:hypothetical protein
VSAAVDHLQGSGGPANFGFCQTPRRVGGAVALTDPRAVPHRPLGVDDFRACAGGKRGGVAVCGGEFRGDKGNL